LEVVCSPTDDECSAGDCKEIGVMTHGMLPGVGYRAL
jgi:hypothetical protein